MNKKLILYEIIGIIVAAAAIGLIYNWLQPRPLPLIATGKIAIVPDSLLTSPEQATTDNLEKTLTYDQVLKLLDNPDFIFIDARSKENYEAGHIGNASNIFPYDDEDVYMEKIYSLPRDKKIVVYCDGGNCDLSHHLAEDLVINGYENVFIYTGGWEEWSQKNSEK